MMDLRFLRWRCNGRDDVSITDGTKASQLTQCVGRCATAMDELEQFLQPLGLVRYLSTFRDEEINDVALLRSMGEEMLRESMEEVCACRERRARETRWKVSCGACVRHC